MNRKPNPLGLRDSKHGKRLPTYRQIDNWRRAGLFGDHHVGLGSGSRDAWTDDEIEALAALNELSEQMATLDLHLSNKMVKSAWPQLVSGMRVTFTFSTQSASVR